MKAKDAKITLLYIVLPVIGVLWAEIHYIVAIFTNGAWDIIPAAGLGVVAYMGFKIIKLLAKHGEKMPLFNNMLANMLTMFAFAQERGKDEEMLQRITLPPAEFERRLRNGRW